MTISVTRGGSEGDPSSPAGDDFGLASANDKGPANIITDEPTCGAWTPIIDALADTQRKGWDKIDRSIPATEWTSEQRVQYEAVGNQMRDATNQTVRLVSITPHRVVRELYEQFIAYGRAYSDSIANYQPSDNYLATVAADASSAVTNICSTISYGSAEAWAPFVPDLNPPSEVPPLSDPGQPSRFMTSTDQQCPEWYELLKQFEQDAAPWDSIDPAIPASEWTPEQRATIDSLVPVINNFADAVESLGRRSDNPLIEDFAVLAAQYRRASVQSLPAYTSPDSYLSGVAVKLTNIIFDACKAVGA